MEIQIEKNYDRLAVVAGLVLMTLAIIVGVALAILSDHQGRRHFGRVLAKWGVVGFVAWTVIWSIVRYLTKPLPAP